MAGDARTGFFPGQAVIDAYGGGGFRFADMSHRGSILCLPSGICAWDARTAADFDEAVFQPVLDEAEAIEFLLVGTGARLAPLPEALRWALRARGIGAEAMATGAAVRTFNILLGEKRRVAAALLAVD